MVRTVSTDVCFQDVPINHTRDIRLSQFCKLALVSRITVAGSNFCSCELVVKMHVVGGPITYGLSGLLVPVSHPAFKVPLPILHIKNNSAGSFCIV